MSTVELTTFDAEIEAATSQLRTLTDSAQAKLAEWRNAVETAKATGAPRPPAPEIDGELQRGHAEERLRRAFEAREEAEHRGTLSPHAALAYDVAVATRHLERARETGGDPTELEARLADAEERQREFWDANSRALGERQAGERTARRAATCAAVGEALALERDLKGQLDATRALLAEVETAYLDAHSAGDADAMAGLIDQLGALRERRTALAAELDPLDGRLAEQLAAWKRGG